MSGYQVGDHVERNSATVPVSQLAQWHREFPGGRRGVVVAIDDMFTVQPYVVQWADGAKSYHDGRDLLPVAVTGQASLFEGVTA